MTMTAMEEYERLLRKKLPPINRIIWKAWARPDPKFNPMKPGKRWKVKCPFRIRNVTQ